MPSNVKKDRMVKSSKIFHVLREKFGSGEKEGGFNEKEMLLILIQVLEQLSEIPQIWSFSPLELKSSSTAQNFSASAHNWHFIPGR